MEVVDIKWTEDRIKEYVENQGYTYIKRIEGKASMSIIEVWCGNLNHKSYRVMFKNFKGNKAKKPTRCPYCSKNKKLTIEEVRVFVEKYDFSLLSVEYINNRTPLTLQCKNGHIFSIRLDNFKQSLKCPMCYRHYGAYTEDEVKQYLESFGYELLNKYIDIHKKIIIKCPKGHIYKTSFNSFKNNGTRCSICRKSKGEEKISKTLKELKIKFISQFVFDDCQYKTYLPFDFYLSEYNILIEYDGIQHYEPVDFGGKGNEWANKQLELTKIKDNIKTQYCENNNIKLIRISYWEFDSIENILSKELKVRK